MTTTDTTLLQRYASALTSSKPIEEKDGRLRLSPAGDLAIYYVPFEHVNADARICIVGITPGPTQFKEAAAEARRLLLSGMKPDQVLAAVKRLAAFSGNIMRPNLIKQLNHWKVHEYLGIQDSSELFMTCGESLVHNTSLLRNATYNRGSMYAGAPKILSVPLLRDHLYETFVQETLVLSKETVYFSMGPAVEEVLLKLVERRILKADQVMPGMLHPSGNNTYRIAYLTGDRSGEEPYRTDIRAYDRGRRKFLETMRIGAKATEGVTA